MNSVEDKFVFEWREGDECIAKGELLTLSSGVIYRLCFGWLNNTDEPRICDLKPIGKTKARYKAEKLAWKQSRIKAGDWVEFIDKSFFEPFRVKSMSAHSILGLAAIDKENTGYPVTVLKPCKPPKPNPMKFEFKIEGGKMLINGDSIGDVRDSYILRLKSEGGWIPVNADEIRQIADLLEKSK